MDIIFTLLNVLAREQIIDNMDKASKEVLVDNYQLKKPTDLFIRDSIMGLGTIMKEDLRNHYYITSVKMGFLGNVMTYAIIERNDVIAEVAVYAHEGLIKGRYAEKTQKKLKELLS